jgi:hypothetical protein
LATHWCSYKICINPPFLLIIISMIIFSEITISHWDYLYSVQIRIFLFSSLDSSFFITARLVCSSLRYNDVTFQSIALQYFLFILEENQISLPWSFMILPSLPPNLQESFLLAIVFLTSKALHFLDTLSGFGCHYP